jgi:hypothetical protein
MNKSFPTVPMYRPLRWLGIAGVAALMTGCVGYYPDSYPSSPQPYYSGGGGGGGYYDEPYDNGGYYSSPGYYGPAYGATTIYYQSYSPGYYYRPGYGYYPPAPRPPRPSGGDYNHGPSHSDNVKEGWANRVDGTTGNNPGRYPHDRNDNRGDNRPPPSSSGPRPSSGDDRGGWANRIGQNGGGDRSPRQVQQAPQAPRQSAPPPRSDDRGSSRGAWADRRDKSN